MTTMTTASLETLLVQRTLRVPQLVFSAGDGWEATRQLEAVLLTEGFALSPELFAYLAHQRPWAVETTGSLLLSAVRELVGGHVRHNAYFQEFPLGVPDTEQFWRECLAEALADEERWEPLLVQLASGAVNLLDLPRYGTYLHTYEEMAAAHDALIADAGDRLTVLERGESLPEECYRLYCQLAGSRVPVSEDDRALLATLADVCLDREQPEMPIRENRAVVNAVRFGWCRPLTVDTPTDILRLACALSDGDVTLDTPTRFRSFARSERYLLCAQLDRVCDRAKLPEARRFAERWKRLGERLHPHEYPFSGVRALFATARGETDERSSASKIERALAAGDMRSAVSLSPPGILLRQADRLLRLGGGDDVVEGIERSLGSVSGRVILSFRQHLANRHTAREKRIFVNRRGKAWVTDDTRIALGADLLAHLEALCDREIERRLPACETLIVDPLIERVALPLSEKTAPRGFGVLPRGSQLPLETPLVRFFVYWKQAQQRTDYDLSVLFLDERFGSLGHASYTSLRGTGYVHSGDIVNAPYGATEFIDIDLTQTQATYVVPQVNVYSGEGFDEVQECFFGFMSRTPEQAGLPFEPATVRFKSTLTGTGRVALPLALTTTAAYWLQLTLAGDPTFNRVEGNKLSTSLLTRAIMESTYLSVAYLCQRYAATGTRLAQDSSGPATYIGFTFPDGLAPESVIVTPQNLRDLIPL